VSQNNSSRGTVKIVSSIGSTDGSEIPSENKKAVLSQRWPRDARYISASNEPLRIWPFEIIQDGDLAPTWIWYNRK